jgi:hypothetical protein
VEGESRAKARLGSGGGRSPSKPEVDEAATEELVLPIDSRQIPMSSVVSEVSLPAAVTTLAQSNPTEIEPDHYMSAPHVSDGRKRRVGIRQGHFRLFMCLVRAGGRRWRATSAKVANTLS